MTRSKSGGVVDIFKSAGIEKTDISILDRSIPPNFQGPKARESPA